MYFIHLAHCTSALTLACVKCAQNTMCKTHWNTVHCLLLWSPGRPVAPWHCPAFVHPSPGKDPKSKFEVWLLLHACCFRTTVKLKTCKSNYHIHKSGTICVCVGMDSTWWSPSNLELGRVRWLELLGWLQLRWFQALLWVVNGIETTIWTVNVLVNTGLS